MKVVILAGGLGTRISEESHLKPKPMIAINDAPILWYIMKIYSHYGFNDFIICCGYKGHIIKEYFANYYLYRSDVTFDFGSDNEMTVHNNVAEPWRVTLVDTGVNTQTGGRIKRVQKYIGDEPFMLTYGDGVSDEFQPEIVIHMAAQPLVRESYKRLVYTYETNVMGTVNVLECVRNTDSVKSVINVTTDKVYKNIEQNIGYVETDELNGYDPYSNSKSCSELVTSSYVNSFLREKGIAVSTMRAGNVITILMTLLVRRVVLISIFNQPIKSAH